jgi:hypothetical protein
MIYRCRLDDGREIPIEADSAGDAIQAALEDNRGHCVQSCSRGTPGEKGTGFIEYEVPRHSALPVQPVLGAVQIVQEAMFAEDDPPAPPQNPV